MGTGVLLGSFALQCLMALGFRIYLLWLNKKKEHEAQSRPVDLQEDSAAHAFADLTDKQVSSYENSTFDGNELTGELDYRIIYSGILTKTCSE